MKKSYPLFPTSLIGSWPRDRKTLLALRQQRNGQLSDQDFNDLIEKETARIIKIQEDAGLDFIVSGELSRDNYCSFVADRIGGVDLLSMNDIIDYIADKKSFEDILNVLDVPSIAIRNAICTGKLEYHPIAVNELKILKKYTDKPVKITLPGPYLLTRSFMCAALAEKKDPTDELEFAKSLLKPVMDHVDRSKSFASLHVCRGNWSNDESTLLSGAYTPLLDLFEYVDPDILTLEYSTPRAGDFSTLMESDQIKNNDIIGLGVENPRLHKAESVDFITGKVKNALQYLPKERIFLNPDCGFATFSNRPVNEEKFIINKIKSLVAASHQLRSEALVD